VIVDDFGLTVVGFLGMVEEAATAFLEILLPSADSESEGFTTSSEGPDGVESASSVLGSIVKVDITDG
jgi:hypothetical protein